MWQGKTEEELKELDFKTFLSYIPARARRSLQRGLTDAQKALMKRIENGDERIKTHCRDMIIVPKMLGMTFLIHRGNDFVQVTILPEMLGHRLGEFADTRKSVTHSSAGVGATRSSKAVSAR